MPAPVLDIASRQDQVSTLGWAKHIAEAFQAMLLCEAVCNVSVRAQLGGERFTVNPNVVATARQQSPVVTRGIGPSADLTMAGQGRAGQEKATLLRRPDRHPPGNDR